MGEPMRRERCDRANKNLGFYSESEAWDQTLRNDPAYINRCPNSDCNSKNLKVENGERFCADCGWVIDEEYNSLNVSYGVAGPLGGMPQTFKDIFKISPYVGENLKRLGKKHERDLRGTYLDKDTGIVIDKDLRDFFYVIMNRCHGLLYEYISPKKFFERNIDAGIAEKPEYCKEPTEYLDLFVTANRILEQLKENGFTHKGRAPIKDAVIRYIILAITDKHSKLRMNIQRGYSLRDMKLWQEGYLHVYEKWDEPILPIYYDKYFVDVFNPNLRYLLFTEQPIDSETVSLLTEAIEIMQRKICTYEGETKKSSMNWVNVMNEIYLGKLVKKEMGINLLKSDDIIIKTLDAGSRAYLRRYSRKGGVTRSWYYSQLKYLKTVDETV